MCNVAWMREYQGITDTDYPINGGEFIEENGYGHEVINFKKNGNYVFGYVQARKGTIDINRLDEGAESYVDDVLVVWRARSSEGAVVIGWYKNARVYRTEQKPNNQRFFNFNGILYNPGWYIRTKYSDATLIPASERNFIVPVTHKGFGSQTFVSYLQHNSPEVQKFKKQLLQYMARVEDGDYSSPYRGKRQPIDQEIKLRIEKSAINTAIDYYTRHGYNVESVEADNVGYDLLAEKGSNTLFIEVKGTSAVGTDAVIVGLTPNEYKISKKAKLKYRICIVCNALGTPYLHEFLWKEANESWFDERTLQRLEIRELTSANLTIVS
jgi:hypothetical protein